MSSLLVARRSTTLYRPSLGTISFVSASSAPGNNTAQAITLPATTILAGDLIVIFNGVANGGTDYTFSAVTSGYTASTQWSDDLSTSGQQGAMWWKTAVGGEQSSSFSVTASTASKYCLIAAVYRGVTSFSLTTGTDGTGTVTAHTSPTIASVSPTGWVVEWYSIRSTTNTTYSTPTGTTLRKSDFGSGGAASDGLLVDSNGNVSSGGGHTTNSLQSSSRGVNASLVLHR